MIKVLKRPLVIDKHQAALLDKEFSAVRWVHHRFIDFEQEHQKILDEIMPELTRVGNVIAKLEGRKKRSEKSTKKELGHHPVILKSLYKRIQELKKVRNASNEWKSAIKWDSEKISKEQFDELVNKFNGDFSDRVMRKQAEESDEDLEKRAVKAGAVPVLRGNSIKYCTLPTRREAMQKEVYRERNCYHSSFQATIDAVKQAKSSVLKERKSGKSARIRRPKVLDSYRIYYQIGKKRSVFNEDSQIYIKRDSLWWHVRLPIGKDVKSIDAKFKGGNWHNLPKDASVLEIQLIRKQVAFKYKYHICITIEGSFEQPEFATTGAVGIDWGHRQTPEGIRAFYYYGTDSSSKDIKLNTKFLPNINSLCKRNLESTNKEEEKNIRKLLDLKIKIQSNIDKTFDAKNVNLFTVSKTGRTIPITSRYQYRRHLMRAGIRTEEESLWLSFEARQEKRIAKINERIDNIRKEIYIKYIREMRMHYSVFGIEDITGNEFKEKYKDKMDYHRKRQNRDVVARYKFISLLEKYGAKVIKIDPAFTTVTCPNCGHVNESTTDIQMSCTGCGIVGDHDEWGSKNVLRKTLQAAAQAAE